MKRFVKTLFAAVLLPSLAGFTVSSYAADTFTPVQKTQIQQIVGQYLKENPEVIIEALQAFQRKQYEQAAQTIKSTQQSASKYVTALFNQANDPVAGNPNGKITVAEFFDYQCPHCVDMAPVMEDVIKTNPDLRVVYKEFPIRGPVSDFASRAALAANKQGKYFEFHNAIMKAKQPLTEASILDIAKNLGLNVDKLKTDMSDASVTKQIESNMKLGQDLKLLGTPAFFIGKTDAKSSNSLNYIPGQISKDQLQDFIDKASK